MKKAAIAVLIASLLVLGGGYWLLNRTVQDAPRPLPLRRDLPPQKCRPSPRPLPPDEATFAPAPSCVEGSRKDGSVL